MSDCPCCSGVAFATCCEPFLAGTSVPQTAEQAMRARYTAHTRVDTKYLMATLHGEVQEDGAEEAARKWAKESKWLGLEILKTSDGGPEDAEGVVEFIARFRDKRGDLHTHHERSLFVKEDGRWLFREGYGPEQVSAKRTSPKIGRNDPCSCGSGKKFKKCCEGASASA